VGNLLIISLAASANFLFQGTSIGISVEEIVVDLYIMLVMIMREHAVTLILSLVWLHIVIFKGYWVIVSLMGMTMSWCKAHLLVSFPLVLSPFAHLLSLKGSRRSV
jgi:hypothetical protein